MQTTSHSWCVGCIKLIWAAFVHEMKIQGFQFVCNFATQFVLVPLSLLAIYNFGIYFHFILGDGMWGKKDWELKWYLFVFKGDNF